MNRNQNETSELRVASRGLRGVPWDRPFAEWRLGSHLETRNSKLAARAFTLTELLVVITIIAILAGLITGAAINALNRAKQAAITLELQQLDGSLENLKNSYGAYPPNSMTPTGVTDGSTPPVLLRDRHESDLQLMFKKAFARQDAGERNILVRKLVGDTTVGGVKNAGGYLEEGMRGTEALVFWLGGFSADVQFPISGPGGPSFAINVTTPIEDLTSRNSPYDFDLGRLGPRDSDGRFDDDFDSGGGRYVEYEVDLNGDGDTNDDGEERRINFWQYTPSGSVEPIVYFDTSRHRAQIQNNAGNFLNNYDPWFYTDGANNDPELRYALKRENETGTDRIEFVNQGKFQLLHCGIDDLWGDFGQASMWIGDPGSLKESTLKVFPTGPFLNDVADTVGNFMTGTLADEQE